MTKDELAAKVAEATGQKKFDIQKALDVMIETITQTVKGNGEHYGPRYIQTAGWKSPGCP